MKRLARLALLLPFFIGFGLAAADEPTIQVPAVASVSPEDLVKEIARLQAARADYVKSGDKTMMMMAIAAGVALFLKLLIDGIQQWKDLSDRAMKAIPIVCTALSGAIIVLDKFAGGDTWVNALILGGGPLASVAVNEIHNALKKKPTGLPLPGKPTSGFVTSGLLFVLCVAGIAAPLALRPNGCATCNATTAKDVGIDIGKCAAGEIPGTVAAVVPDVVQQIQGTDANWSAFLTTLEAKGVDFTICAISAAYNRLTAPVGGTAAISSTIPRGVARAKEYLAKHHVYVAGPDAGVQ
jgi:hypothetical protein